MMAQLMLSLGEFDEHLGRGLLCSCQVAVPAWQVPLVCGSEPSLSFLVFLVLSVTDRRIVKSPTIVEFSSQCLLHAF